MIELQLLLPSIRLFHQHLKKLSGLISPTHKDLSIPRMYHFECPWPAAQREIYMINAYKVSTRSSSYEVNEALANQYDMLC